MTPVRKPSHLFLLLRAQVVGEGAPLGRVGELLSLQPDRVSCAPAVSLVDAPLPQKELGEAMTSPKHVLLQVFPQTDEIPEGFLLYRRDADGGELTGP